MPGYYVEQWLVLWSVFLAPSAAYMIWRLCFFDPSDNDEGGAS